MLPDSPPPFDPGRTTLPVSRITYRQCLVVPNYGKLSLALGVFEMNQGIVGCCIQWENEGGSSYGRRSVSIRLS